MPDLITAFSGHGQTWDPSLQIKQDNTSFDAGITLLGNKHNNPVIRFILGIWRWFSSNAQQENVRGIDAYFKQLEIANPEMARIAREEFADRKREGRPLTLRAVRRLAVEKFCNEEFINAHIMLQIPKEMQGNPVLSKELESQKNEKVRFALQVILAHVKNSSEYTARTRRYRESDLKARNFINEKIEQHEKIVSRLSEQDIVSRLSEQDIVSRLLQQDMVSSDFPTQDFPKEEEDKTFCAKLVKSNQCMIELMNSMNECEREFASFKANGLKKSELPSVDAKIGQLKELYQKAKKADDEIKKQFQLLERIGSKTRESIVSILENRKMILNLLKNPTNHARIKLGYTLDEITSKMPLLEQAQALGIADALEHLFLSHNGNKEFRKKYELLLHEYSCIEVH